MTAWVLRYRWRRAPGISPKCAHRAHHNGLAEPAIAKEA